MSAVASWTDHLVVAPVVLPLVTGAILLLIDDQRHLRKALVNLGSLLLGIAIAVYLLRTAGAGRAPVYLLGAWPAPFGIVFHADRLSSVMLLLSGTLALAGTVYSVARWHRMGSWFHPLVQFLMMGLSGAFLTGDLFNLFVFFELLLAASYGLALHGSGAPRVRASLHYVAINVTASLFFLIGASLIYGVTGTLNMADLAVRVPRVAAEDRVLLEAGGAVLGVAFLVKAGMWPLGFWLPTTYAAASAPAAAMFAVLSKVGIYAVLRLWLLMFGPDIGASAGFGDGVLFIGGLVTLFFGAAGMLAAQDLTRLAGYSLLVSSGTLLATVSLQQAPLTGAALYYLVSSTLGVAAFYLLAELADRANKPGAGVLAITAEAFGDDPPEDEEAGTAIPATTAMLGISFVCCALLIAGLPPFPGFIAKFAMLSTLLTAEPVPVRAWVLVALLILSGLAALIALGRFGVRIFWASPDYAVPRVRVVEMLPVAGLLAASVALTVEAGPALGYLQQAADALHAPEGYVRAVLGGAGR